MIRLRAIVRSLYVRFYRLTSQHRFHGFGRGVYIFPGTDISGEHGIRLGDDVIVLDDTVLAVVPGGARPNPRLSIGCGSNIGRRNHIIALEQVDIGSRVLTASNVYITDCAHTFSATAVPIMDQPVARMRPVRIGDGAWIGQNVCIMGCSVGRNAVIGANSVVLQDVPDYCVAAGTPARVIRRLDTATQTS